MEISVIVPCYNAELYIEKTLDSIYDQLFFGVELLVVDDGSADNTLLVLDNYTRKQSFAFKVIRQENRGPSAARNIGLINGKGKYIQFFDSDDIMHPEKLKLSMAIMERYNVDAVVTEFIRFREDENISFHTCDLTKHQVLVGVDASRYVLEYGIGAPRVLYKRAILEKAGGFNENLVNNEDHELNFRLVAQGAKFAVLNLPLMYYRQHDSVHRVTKSSKKYNQSIQASKVILSQLDSIADQGLREFVMETQANKIAYASVNMLRNGDLKGGLENLALAKGLSSKLVVSKNRFYNMANRLLGVGKLDYLLGMIKNLIKGGK